jgi:hypothetical protein
MSPLICLSADQKKKYGAEKGQTDEIDERA